MKFHMRVPAMQPQCHLPGLRFRPLLEHQDVVGLWPFGVLVVLLHALLVASLPAWKDTLRLRNRPNKSVYAAHDSAYGATQAPPSLRKIFTAD